MSEEEKKAKAKELDKEQISLKKLQEVLGYFLEKESLYKTTILKGIDAEKIFDSSIKRVENEIAKIKELPPPPAPPRNYYYIEIVTFLIFIIAFGLSGNNWFFSLGLALVYYYIAKNVIWKEVTVKPQSKNKS